MEAIETKQIHIRFTRALSSYDNRPMPNTVSVGNSLLSSLIRRMSVTNGCWKLAVARADSPEC